MDERKVTVLDAVEVRYSYLVPSVSRRGGVRLHPIFDGVARMPEERTVQHRDIVGNKLRDVINPDTGFCIAVVSPILGGRINQGTSGSHTVETRRGDVTRHDSGIYRDDEGRVLRTLDMGDGKLPTFKSPKRDGNDARTQKQPRSGNARGARKPKPDMTGVPGGTGKNGSITRADVMAYIKVVSKGRTVPLTPQVLKMAREALEARRADAARKMGKIK